MLARFLAAVAAMVVVVAASNILVLYPLQVQLGSINLADLLTWGAFTFPFAFLVTDLANRYDGARQARQERSEQQSRHHRCSKPLDCKRCSVGA